MKLNSRLLVIILLGFVSGLPLALSGSTLQAWLTEAHISIVTIGWFTLVGQPYIYKFLWAPWLDRYIPPLLGRRRGWILLMQIALIICFISVALITPQQQFILLAFVALLIAFFSATQDIAIDAYRTDVLHEAELGIGNALFTAAYRIGMIVAGGLALILASCYGWHWTYIAMAIFMLIGVVAVWYGPEPEYPVDMVTPQTLRDAIWKPLQVFFQRKYAWLFLLLILMYKFGEALATALTTNFLLSYIGFSLVTLGSVYKVIAIIASLTGAFAGGWLYQRLKLWGSLFYLGIAQALPILLYWLLAIVGKNYSLMVTAVAAENFDAGMATTALMVFMMKLCDKRYTATQYALLSAVAAVGRVYTGPLAGTLVAHWGWPLFFPLALTFTIPGLILIVVLRQPINRLENMGLLAK